MPNHSFNTLQISKGNLDEALPLILNKEGKVDFNIVAPMPEELDYKEGQFDDTEEKTDTCGVPLSIAEERKKKYGVSNWYEWHIQNWGTKWNAYGMDEAFCILDVRDWPAEGIQFLTAWGPPIEWLLKLSEKLPDHVFRLYYDIELGEGSGYIEVQAGEMLADVED